MISMCSVLGCLQLRYTDKLYIKKIKFTTHPWSLLLKFVTQNINLVPYFANIAWHTKNILKIYFSRVFQAIKHQGLAPYPLKRPPAQHHPAPAVSLRAQRTTPNLHSNAWSPLLIASSK